MGTAIVVRQSVPPSLAYAQYRQQLREDFCWACAYCSIAEAEATAIGFQIDHYTAKEHGGNDDYGNLYWSCEHCNRRKSAVNTVPPLHYVIRIDCEDPADHYESGEGYRLNPKTETGQHNIAVLDLDRRTLRLLREQRARLGYSREVIDQGLRTLAQVRIDLLPRHVRSTFVKFRDQIRAQAELAQSDTDDFIRERCRSPFLEPDPDQTARTRARREHLRSINALQPRARASVRS
jgi:hypothetical protein